MGPDTLASRHHRLDDRAFDYAAHTARAEAPEGFHPLGGGRIANLGQRLLVGHPSGTPGEWNVRSPARTPADRRIRRSVDLTIESRKFQLA